MIIRYTLNVYSSKTIYINRELKITSTDDLATSHDSRPRGNKNEEKYKYSKQKQTNPPQRCSIKEGGGVSELVRAISETVSGPIAKTPPKKINEF